MTMCTCCVLIDRQEAESKGFEGAYATGVKGDGENEQQAEEVGPQVHEAKKQKNEPMGFTETEEKDLLEFIEYEKNEVDTSTPNYERNTSVPGLKAVMQVDSVKTEDVETEDEDKDGV